jgi:hypothetical protein
MTGSILLALLACGDSKDDSGLVAGDPPDVTGSYNLILKGVTGCDSDPTWIQGWADGPFKITGEPNALTFDFFDKGAVFDGQVTDAGGYSFFGLMTYNGADLSVSNAGSFIDEDGSWHMTGEFTVVVSTDPKFKSDDCTITGPSDGYQIAG